MNEVNLGMLKRAKEFGLDGIEVNISAMSNRVYKFDHQTIN